jgi:hypothetical protein
MQELKIIYSQAPKDPELTRLQWQAETGLPLIATRDKDNRLIITERRPNESNGLLDKVQR